MAHTFRSHDPSQCFLFPPTPSDWLDQDHKAYFIRGIVDALDMAEFFAAYSQDGRGAPAYCPRMVLSIFLYGWLRGVYSSRKLACLCSDDVGARYLVGAEQPDFRSLNRFRLRHGEAMNALFLQSVHLCAKAGMVALTDVAVDGSRMASYASKHKNIHYGKLAAEEARHLEYLRQVHERAEREDAAEDELYGADNAGPVVDERMKSSEGRLALLREARVEMDAEAKAQAKVKRKAWDETAPSERPHTKRPDPETATPSERAQYNPVDPQSRIQYSCQSGFLQGYNGQVAVDADSQVIVACDLSSTPTDVGFLTSMLDQAISNTGITPKQVLADGGYYSRKNVEDVEARGMTALIPPPLKKREREDKPAALLSEGEVAGLTPKARMRYLLGQPAMQALFQKRRQSVEPVFGQMKGSPGNMRFRRFLRRTRDKCRQDWMLLCCVHNLAKYITWKTA